MIDISFPEYHFKIRQQDDRQMIFDVFRKRWMILTPEEWVRQNFLQYLVQVKRYPTSLIAVEKEIRIGEMKKRFDVVVYKEAKPWMIIECKEMNVTLSENTLQQILNYNIALMVEHLVITNGKQTFAVSINEQVPRWLKQLPDYI